MTKYLNIIQPLYADVDFANDVIPFVEDAFKAKAGSLTGTINFMDFGDVIDAIVLHLPLDKPTSVEGIPRYPRCYRRPTDYEIYTTQHSNLL